VTYQLQFAGVTLDGFHEWRERHPSRVIEHTFPRHPGSVGPVTAAPGARNITLVGDVWKDTAAELETYLDELRHILTDLGRDRLIKTDNNRFLNVIKSELEMADVAGESPALHRRVTIQFLAANPYWYSTTESSQEDNLNGTSDTFLVQNFGKARTPPVFYCTRSAGTDQNDVVISNTTTGLFLKWEGTFEVGKVLVFDCVNRRVTYGGADAMNNFVPGSINLNLEPGNNNFAYAGPGEMVITTHWHERWS
jgi:hypothetical protein